MLSALSGAALKETDEILRNLPNMFPRGTCGAGVTTHIERSTDILHHSGASALKIQWDPTRMQKRISHSCIKNEALNESTGRGTYRKTAYVGCCTQLRSCVHHFKHFFSRAPSGRPELRDLGPGPGTSDFDARFGSLLSMQPMRSPLS